MSSFWQNEWANIADLVAGEFEGKQFRYINRIVDDLDAAYQAKDFQKWITLKKRLEKACKTEKGNYQE